MDELERTATLYHELAHDILNASHNKDVEGHIMHPYNRFKSITQLVEAMAILFQEYKDGTLMVFNEDTSY